MGYIKSYYQKLQKHFAGGLCSRRPGGGLAVRPEIVDFAAT